MDHAAGSFLIFLLSLHCWDRIFFLVIAVVYLCVGQAMLKELPVKITIQAVSQIKYIFERKNIPPDYGLRIGMKGSGCAGTSFFIGFDKQKEGDSQYTIENIPVYIEKKHVMYLFGVQVDFVENEIESGFIFNS